MLDALAKVVLAFQIFGVDVQNMVYAAITDGMAAHLIASIVGFLADMMIKLVAFLNQAIVGRVVGVGFKQFRAARA